MKISIKNTAKLNDEQLKEAYRKMWLVRYFEEKVDFFFANFFHSLPYYTKVREVMMR